MLRGRNLRPTPGQLPGLPQPPRNQPAPQPHPPTHTAGSFPFYIAGPSPTDPTVSALGLLLEAKFLSSTSSPQPRPAPGPGPEDAAVLAVNRCGPDLSEASRRFLPRRMKELEFYVNCLPCTGLHHCRGHEYRASIHQELPQRTTGLLASRYRFPAARLTGASVSNAPHSECKSRATLRATRSSSGSCTV